MSYEHDSFSNCGNNCPERQAATTAIKVLNENRDGLFKEGDVKKKVRSLGLYLTVLDEVDKDCGGVSSDYDGEPQCPRRWFADNVMRMINHEPPLNIPDLDPPDMNDGSSDD